MFDAIAKPFGVLMMWLYELVGNYGLALILFALIVKLILLPFQMKSKRGMMQTARLQPKMKELERKHGANKQKYNEELQKLYREENVKPLSGCLWSLLPFPIMLALYTAVRQPLTMMMGIPASTLAEGGALLNKLKSLGFKTPLNAAYEQIAQSKFITENFDKFVGLSGEIVDKLRQINYNFLGLDLSKQPQWDFFWNKETDWSNPSVWIPGLFLFLLPVLSGVLTFLQSKITTKMQAPAAPAEVAKPGEMPAKDPTQGSMKMMTYMMPLISVYIGFIMPASIGLYWIASSLFGLLQEIWLTKRYTRLLDAEDAVKREHQRVKDAELEEKRRETERKKAENATERNPNTSKDRRKNIEKSDQKSRAAKWDEASNPKAVDPSREGERRFARGRAYSPERFENLSDDADDTVIDGEVIDDYGEDIEDVLDDSNVIDITDDVEEEDFTESEDK